MNTMNRLLVLFFALVFVQEYAQTKKVSRDWTSFSQSIEISTDSLRKFKLVAHVKVETDDEKAWAGIWARVDNKPEQGRGFFDNMRDRPIKSDVWNSYTVQGVINAKSEKLVFGGICNNNGKFFYDKFEVYLEDENGEFQPVAINNASFETKIVNTDVEGWTQGVNRGKVLVNEFTYATTDDRADGNYAILIEGKGISETTGNIEGVFPNIGVVISILFILILVFSLLTYSSSTEEDHWSIWGRIGFRFSFIYFMFFIFFYNNGAYPFLRI